MKRSEIHTEHDVSPAKRTKSVVVNGDDSNPRQRRIQKRRVGETTDVQNGAPLNQSEEGLPASTTTGDNLTTTGPANSVGSLGAPVGDVGLPPRQISDKASVLAIDKSSTAEECVTEEGDEGNVQRTDGRNRLDGGSDGASVVTMESDEDLSSSRDSSGLPPAVRAPVTDGRTLVDIRNTPAPIAPAVNTTSASGSDAPESTQRAGAVVSRRVSMKAELAIHERKGFVRRIENLVNVVDVERLVYAADMVPTDIAWGRRVPCGLDSERLVTLGKSNEPITIWMVGRVSQVWLTPLRPTNRPISIYIVPVTEQTSRQAHSLLTRLSKPPAATVHGLMDEIQFSRFMTINKESGERDQFNGCYDATEYYDKDLLAMPHLPTSELKKLDFVLVSAKIRRYRNIDKSGEQDKQGSASNRNSASWTTWRASFELQNIGLLKRHTAEIKVVRDDPDDAENRYV